MGCLQRPAKRMSLVRLQAHLLGRQKGRTIEQRALESEAIAVRFITSFTGWWDLMDSASLLLYRHGR